MVRFLILTLTLCTLVAGYAMDTAERIFSPRFRTLKTWSPGNFDGPPTIRMGTDDRVEILFDEIGDQNSWLRWRLVHCNADWQPSSLVDSEIVDGFNGVDIEDFAYSNATYVHYVNYRIVLPDEQIGILHSGNYLLQVYDPDEPDEVLLQTRFQVSENTVPVTGMYNARTDRGYNGEWQQLWVSAAVDLGSGANPYSDFRLEVSQNGRELTRRTIQAPSRVNGNTLIYEHQPQLIFPASNEYLRFESLSNRFPGMNVDSLRYMGSNFHVWLKPDRPRAGMEYHFDQTQHGRYLVREYNSTDSNIGADYVTVHFLLRMDRLADGDVYVDGEMTHGGFNDANRMTYDPQAGGYVLELPLKQGAYNYQYLVRDSGGQFTAIDGNKYETGNQYLVTLWQRRPGERADRLVGQQIIQ